MKVYLAAPYAARDALLARAAELVRLGFIVTSSWLNESHVISDKTIGPAGGLASNDVRALCDEDLRDVNRADVVVVFTGLAAETMIEAGMRTLDALHSGGRHVETGYAIAKGKRVLVIGPAENIFHRGYAEIVHDWHDAVLALTSLRERCRRDAEGFNLNRGRAS